MVEFEDVTAGGGAVSSAKTLSLLMLRSNVTETTAVIKKDPLLNKNPGPFLKVALIFWASSIDIEGFGSWTGISNFFIASIISIDETSSSYASL
jgi:hypothetical protein